MRALALLCLGCGVVASGCGGSATTVIIDVQNGEMTAPTAVTVSVFDDFGLLGRSRMAHPALPGQLTIAGLPDTTESIRVVALGDDPRMLDGVRFDSEPRTQMTQKLTLRAAITDSDGDGVPDSLDDCVMVPDPDQHNTDGKGTGDACAPVVIGGDDLALPVDPGDGGVVFGSDMVMVAGADLAHLPGADLAHPIEDMTPPGPDLYTPPSTDFANVPLLTEGFENGVSGAIWTMEQGSGSIAASPNIVHRGFYALHVQQNALSAGQSSRVDVVETAAVPLPDAWIRVFAYVPGGQDPTSVSIVSLEQTGSAHKGMRLNLANGSFGTTDTVPTTPVNLSATTPAMPTDQWVCLEWHVHVTSGGYAKAYVNGVEVAALTTVQDTQPTPNVAEVALGLSATPGTATSAREIWFDDVAIDANPIGCSK